MTYNGIDYGLGQSNIDHSTGIRFGVIHAGEVGQSWYDDSEGQYSDVYHCPKCGNEALDSEKDTDLEIIRECAQENDDSFDPESDAYDTIEFLADKLGFKKSEHDSDHNLVCLHDDYLFGTDMLESEPISFTYDSEGYQAEQSYDDPDIFITKSPYYTLCQFCSPCAPGAGYIMNRGTVKAYCFGHEWFEGNKAPYPVYSVATGEEVKS